MIEGAPAERMAGLDNFIETLPFAFAQANGFLGAQIRAHNFEQGMPPAADAGNQALADNPAQGISKARPDLLLLIRFKHTENTVDGLTSINCVEGAEHQVACLGGAERDFDRLAIAHFAHQDDFGGLSQGGAQTVGEGVKVGAQFALIECGFVVRVNKLDRVFQGDDMDGLGMIDFVKNRGKGGGFAGTGGAGDQHQAGLFTWDLTNDIGELEPFQCGNNRVELAQHDGAIPTLRKDVDTKPGLIRKGIGCVTRAAAQQVDQVPLVVAYQIERHHFGLKRSQLLNRHLQAYRL